MRNNQSKKSISKSILVIIITITILVLSGVTVYAKVIQPKKFEEYMQQGYVYLEENKYEEAVLSFEKAIKMDKKNIKAKVMAAESCIKINQIQKAGTYLLEAQDLDLKNEDLTLYLINMVKIKDKNIANQILKKYLDAVGVDNVSDKLRTEILQSTDNDELSENITKALSLYHAAVEGSEEGNYKEGSKEELFKVIEMANGVNDSYFYTQKEIDEMAAQLSVAIKGFESKKISLMPSNLGNIYRNKLQVIQSEWENRLDNYTCFADFYTIHEEALNKFEALLEEIYSDLNNYLPENKKQEIQSHKNNYYKEKQNMNNQNEAYVQETINEFGWVENSNGWGHMEGLAEHAKQKCYDLINEYM